MNIREYLEDSHKVLYKKPRRQLITEPYKPIAEPKVTIMTIDYNDLTKNQLVAILWERGIEHNKRQLKSELVALLEQDDKKNI